MNAYGQELWGDDPATSTAAALLAARFNSVYSGLLTIGSGFSMTFDDANSVLAYLPADGPSGALSANLFDPLSTESGAFGGYVTALRLNIDFSDAGFLHGTSGLRFGDLTLCNFSAVAALNGQTVRQLYANADALLGAGSAAYSIDDVVDIIHDLDSAFDGGFSSVFAQDHIVNGSCPP